MLGSGRAHLELGHLSPPSSPAEFPTNEELPLTYIFDSDADTAPTGDDGISCLYLWSSWISTRSLSQTIPTYETRDVLTQIMANVLRITDISPTSKHMLQKHNLLDSSS